MQGLIGKKLGMTQVFDAEGRQIPVTVVQAGPCTVVQRKTAKTDGYEAVQIGFEDQKEQRLTRPVAGHYKKAAISPKRVLREFEVDAGDEAKAGDVLDASLFEGSAYVDVVAVSKGRGFQGVVRRFRMGGGPAAHGSGTHRRPGSIGNREWPGRIFKNKKMPGHMGATRVTTQNLKVIQVRKDDSVLLLRGAVPGPTGGIVIVRKALKKKVDAQ